MTDTLKITTIQTHLFWENKDKNLIHFELKIRNIREQTDVIILPEMFSTGFSMTPKKFAETMDGKTVNFMKQMAAKKDVLLIGSAIIEEDGKYFNRLLAVFPDGNVEYYDKRHLFSPGGEDKEYSAGTKQLVINYKGWRINPLICYDLRFPVWSRSTQNFDIQVYIANWPQKRSTHWKTLLKARAIENQAFVIGVNRIGTDGNGYEHSGDTCVFDAWGEQISFTNPSEDKNETVILTKESIIKARKLLPILNDADNFTINTH